jgi:hypothetical protein
MQTIAPDNPFAASRPAAWTTHSFFPTCVAALLWGTLFLYDACLRAFLWRDRRQSWIG